MTPPARRAVERYGDDQSLVDFGSRRAHGIDAGLLAARSAYIGGFDGTSNVAAGRAFDLPVFGTMAHSWVQSFPTERDGRFERDVVALDGEDVPGEEQLVTVYEDGSLVYSPPSLDEVRDRRRRQVGKLPAETRAIREPAAYPVEPSDGLRSKTDSLREELSDRYLDG